MFEKPREDEIGGDAHHRQNHQPSLSAMSHAFLLITIGRGHSNPRRRGKLSYTPTVGCRLWPFASSGAIRRRVQKSGVDRTRLTRAKSRLMTRCGRGPLPGASAISLRIVLLTPLGVEDDRRSIELLTAIILRCVPRKSAHARRWTMDARAARIVGLSIACIYFLCLGLAAVNMM